MNKFKNSTISIFGIVILIFLATACENGRKHPADDILSKVSERYANLTQFEINATFTSEVTVGINVEKQDYSVYYAVMQPGNMHLEVSGRSSGLTLVSDGNTTWTYLPGQNQYRVDRSSPLQAVGKRVNVSSLSGNFVELGEQLTGAFKYINVGLESAIVIDENTIVITIGAQQLERQAPAQFVHGHGDRLLAALAQDEAFRPGRGYIRRRQGV